MSIINVVLSGGIGSRLWPLSRKVRPKQYLNLFDGTSLFQQTVLRNIGICDGLLIVGNESHAILSEQSLKEIGVTMFNKVIESVPRNTAAAIAFAALKTDPENILLITPSDHVVADEEKYRNAVLRGIELAQQGNIVTFGIKPSAPETGYGYIQADKNEVVAFKEKPNLELALQFLESGDYLWNSGMFCFKAKIFLEELQSLSPEVYESSVKAFNFSDDDVISEELSMLIPSISVDFAVMEKSDKLKVVESHFSWSDLGSFESLYEYLKSTGYAIDENGNMVFGASQRVDFLGLRNCILVYTDDAILVLQKEHSQDVKKIYEAVSKSDQNLI